MEKRRKFTREFKLEAVRLIKERGVSYALASQDLGVHVSQLRNWVKALADDPQYAFPGHGQMKPEQQEIARLKREVAKLKAERDFSITTDTQSLISQDLPSHRRQSALFKAFPQKGILRVVAAPPRHRARSRGPACAMAASHTRSP
jgi:transposase